MTLSKGRKSALSNAPHERSARTKTRTVGQNLGAAFSSRVDVASGGVLLHVVDFHAVRVDLEDKTSANVLSILLKSRFQLCANAKGLAVSVD